MLVIAQVQDGVGPPYALVQGVMSQLSKQPPREQTTTIKYAFSCAPWCPCSAGHAHLSHRWPASWRAGGFVGQADYLVAAVPQFTVCNQYSATEVE
jgi:hypothetical protein